MGAEIELLICNPNYTITNKKERSFHSPQPGDKDFQKEKRVCAGIGELHRFVLGNYDKVKIKCYRTPGSLRGRNFGDRWIQVGWYTYQTSGDAKIYGSPQIWGDTNSVITAPISSPEGQILKSMFNEVFEKMWRESVPPIDVCGGCADKAKCFGSNEAADQWLRLVSPKKKVRPKKKSR
jgi:MoaA/NifB/PqqE/SkfB family radical SAM enzyme